MFKILIFDLFIKLIQDIKATNVIVLAMATPDFLKKVPQEYLLFSIGDDGKKDFDRRCFNKGYNREQVIKMKQPNQHIGIMYYIKETPYVVVDIDTDDYSPEDLFNDCDIDSCFVKGNTKGYHVWCEMKDKTEEYKKNRIDCGKFTTIDFLGEKVFEREGKKWTHDDASLLHPESIAKTFNEGTFAKKVVKAVIGSNTPSTLKKVIDLIDIKFCDNRGDWVKIVLAMKKVGLPFEFADAWSKKSSKYSSEGMETAWNSYTTDELITSTEGTLRYYAKKSNLEAYALLLATPITDETICANDAECADKILEMLEGDLLYCDGRMYMKLGNCWICDTLEINNALMTYIMNAEVYKMTKIGPVPYWKDYNPADKIYKTICCRITETAFEKNLFHTTTKHRVAFRNGVLDFREKRFYKWNEITFPYYTTNIIKTDYVVDDDFEILVSKVFEPIFGEKTELALKYLARAIAGCIEDKNFATYMGNRNCGKGVMFELLGVFGPYVSAFTIECLEEDAKHNTMTARDYYWMLPLEFARLAISQEVPTRKTGCVLRSDLLKKICSGGDVLTARRNYDRKDTQFNVDCSLFCLGNDEITTNGDVNEHRLVFEGRRLYRWSSMKT